MNGDHRPRCEAHFLTMWTLYAPLLRNPLPLSLLLKERYNFKGLACRIIGLRQRNAGLERQATDISASMLKLASAAAREEGLMNVETRVMNAENIDLDADSLDSVICQQGFMLFSNPAKALIGAPRGEA